MRRWKSARLAPYLFVFLWSTGFVGAKYGLPYADPFIFLSLRIFIAAAILFVAARLMGTQIALTRGEIGKSSLIGLFLHALYLGGVFYAISQGVSAGVAAVITSLQPVFVSILAVKVLGEKLRWSQFAGLVTGLSGVVLVLGPTFDSSVSAVGIAAVFVALLGSTTATLMQKKFGATIPMVADGLSIFSCWGFSRHCSGCKRWHAHRFHTKVCRRHDLVNSCPLSGSRAVIATPTQQRQRSISFITVLSGATSNCP